MKIPRSITALNNLPHVLDSDTIYFEFVSFVNLLKSKKLSDDKCIRQSNIWNEINGHDYPCTKVSDGKKYISFESVLRFSFGHIQNISVCRSICKDVTCTLLLDDSQSVTEKDTSKSTILALYRCIAGDKLLDINCSEGVFSDLNLHHRHISTLYKEYADYFTADEWNKICLFEWHYSLYCKQVFQHYDDAVRAKWDYYEECRTSGDLSHQLQKHCQKTIERNFQRRAVSSCLNDIECIIRGITHFVKCFEDIVCSISETYFKESVRAVCVQCTNKCEHVLGVHLFVELSNSNSIIENLEDFALLVRKAVQRKHCVLVPIITFLSPHTLDQFRCLNCSKDGFHRYKLLHEVDEGKLTGLIVKIIRSDTSEDEDSDSSSVEHICDNCVSSVKSWVDYPLDWRSFHIMKEWYLFVPYPLQILLQELFIDKKGICRSQDGPHMLQKRIQRLYTLLDIGLCTLNQKHIGVVSERNTAELIINHQSSAAVFSITNEAGISQSLRTAFRWLQTEADVDKCFYKTYVKRYKMAYENVLNQGIQTTSISMRDCHVILGLDNLVRLRYHTDPEPGENRTSQLCTLPLTLKGLPRDHKITTTWHDPSCTSPVNEQCTCMSKTVLEGNNQHLLHELLPNEQRMKDKFMFQSIWGLAQFWNQIRSFIEDNTSCPTISMQDSELSLNDTMESLHISDRDEQQQGMVDRDEQEYTVNRDEQQDIEDRDEQQGMVNRVEQQDMENRDELQDIEDRDEQQELEDRDDQHDREDRDEQQDIVDRDEQQDMEDGDEQHDIEDRDEQQEFEDRDDQHDMEDRDEQQDIVDIDEQQDMVNRDEQQDMEDKDEQQDMENRDEQQDMEDGDEQQDIEDRDEQQEFEDRDDQHDMEDRDEQQDIVDIDEQQDMVNRDEQQDIEDRDEQQDMENRGEQQDMVNRDDQEYMVNRDEQQGMLDGDEQQDIADRDDQSCSFSTFNVPSLLTRHPTPAVGRDDDKSKLREVLLDILQGLNRLGGKQFHDRIILAPDYKLSKNLIQLIKEQFLFRQFLPEFPLLHLKKSKITNLFSAYKAAGLHELLQYMKDDEHEKDWKKLVTLANIETAARNIKRLSLAFHLSFLVVFLKSLSDHDRRIVLNDFQHRSFAARGAKWTELYKSFLKEKSMKNATFALHADMMQHCDEIVAISIAERIGGPSGYSLMLSAVKDSLPFSFLNGASSYASFCVTLLNQHYTAGVFHQNMKTTLFSTPHHGSHVNIALDTQREMDHRDAMKAFRPGSNLSSVIPKMAIVDTMAEIQESKTPNSKKSDVSESSIRQRINLSARDFHFALPASKLILRRGGLADMEEHIPHNVYATNSMALPEAILDKHSYEIGKFLIQKYCHQAELFGIKEQPDIQGVKGSDDLIKKLRQSKGTTIKRTTCKKVAKDVSDTDKREHQRQQSVRRKTKVVQCLSSAMNTCQAIVKPDCSKPCVQKATGIKNAIVKVLELCLLGADPVDERLLQDKELIWFDMKVIPKSIAKSVTTATVEFAGVKFKTNATSGQQYLQQVENGMIRPLQRRLPNLKRMVICEEKYSFTPDDFKAATRTNRQKQFKPGISHLKVGEDIVCQKKFSKSAVIETHTGRRLISNFLARNLHQLQLRNLIIDIDSELVIEGCSCGHNDSECQCKLFAKPTRAVYDDNGFKETTFLQVKQRKGEAEMAQVDWLKEVDPADGDVILSVVTSGDIDSLVIHLFALSRHWPKNEEGKYRNRVLVLLQKQKPEMFNITGILEILESYFGEQTVGFHFAIALCLGGNDFLPKFYGISHSKWIEAILKLPCGFKELLKLDANGVLQVDDKIYLQLVKMIYCPSQLDPNKLSLEEVRNLSIKRPGKGYRNPCLWMPPLTALLKVIGLVNCQISYLNTVYDHSASLPNFIASGCLTKNSSGDIEYNLGPDVHCDDPGSLITSTDEDTLKSRRAALRKRKTRASSGTPDKQQTKRPLTSTPRSRKILIPVEYVAEDLSDVVPLAEEKDN